MNEPIYLNKQYYCYFRSMYKGLAFLYFVCFSLYIIYSREPDFFDGETLPAAIHFKLDSVKQQTICKAVFEVNKKIFEVDAEYFFKNYKENQIVTIIYHPRKPQLAKVYSWWGYWITWGEVIVSIVLFVALFQIAVAVTKNPSASALIEQLEYKAEKKKRYED